MRVMLEQGLIQLNLVCYIFHFICWAGMIDAMGYSQHGLSLSILRVKLMPPQVDQEMSRFILLKLAILENARRLCPAGETNLGCIVNMYVLHRFQELMLLQPHAYLH